MTSWKLPTRGGWPVQLPRHESCAIHVYKLKDIWSLCVCVCMYFTFPLFLFDIADTLAFFFLEWSHTIGSVIARSCQEPTAKGHKKWWFPKAQTSCCRSSLSGIIKAFACWCYQVAGCTAISSLFVSVAQHATNVEGEHFGEVWGSIVAQIINSISPKSRPGKNIARRASGLKLIQWSVKNSWPFGETLKPPLRTRSCSLVTCAYYGSCDCKES